MSTSQNQELNIYIDSEKFLKDLAQRDINDLQFPGIVVKLKKLNANTMDLLIHILENSKTITYLELQEVNITKPAVILFNKFLQSPPQVCKLEKLSLLGVVYEDGEDCRKMLDGIIRNNGRLISLQINGSSFIDQRFSLSFQDLLLRNKHILEIDLSNCSFSSQVFGQFGLVIAKEIVRIKTLKLRGMIVGELEGKILDLIATNNQSLINLDVSQIRCTNPENLHFLSHFNLPADNFTSLISTLNMEQIKNCDISELLPNIGRQLSSSKNQITILNMRNNKTKPFFQQQFFQALMPNRNLKILNMEKNNLTDIIMESLEQFMKQQDIQLEELIISKNLITSVGLRFLSEGIKFNKSIQKLHLSFNNFDDSNGLLSFSDSLCYNHTIKELYMIHCHLKNNGMQLFCKFLDNYNKTLQTLDLSQNPFNDDGLKYLCNALERNQGLLSLSIAKCEEITDKIGIYHIADCLKENKYLRCLDLRNIKIKKTATNMGLIPALEQNITLQKIIGKLPAGKVDLELQDNIVIEQEIIQRIQLQKNNSYILLNLQDKKLEILRPSLKLINLKNIQNVDFSTIGADDYSLGLIASYVEKNPPLQYLSLSCNPFTDVGLIKLCEALKTNKNLVHLIMLSCPNITDLSIEHLHGILSEINIDLYDLHIDLNQFNQELGKNVTKEAQTNKAIRKYLKPLKKISTDQRHLVVFESSVKDYFESAVKCWRIMKPNYISLTNEKLNDVNMKVMFEYLIRTGGVQQIVLRRNHIGDEGAKEIAKFIEINDPSCTNIELSRNLIKDEGAKAIYKALKKNSRINTLLIDFGNEISSKILQKIDMELRSNHNIEEFVKPSLQENNEDFFGKLQIHDKGPEFMRCSLKSIQLFKLQQLDLSDNLLTSVEVKKIAKTLKLNIPLKMLILSNNLIDSKGAEYLAEGLSRNIKLRVLNISYNNLCDKGIATLILPIAKQRLNQTKSGIQSSQITSKLKFLDVSFNNHSYEALKHVYALLFAKKDIVVEINDPHNSTSEHNTENKSPNSSQISKHKNYDERASPKTKFQEKHSPTLKRKTIRKSIKDNQSNGRQLDFGRHLQQIDPQIQQIITNRNNLYSPNNNFGQQNFQKQNTFSSHQSNQDFKMAVKINFLQNENNAPYDSIQMMENSLQHLQMKRVLNDFNQFDFENQNNIARSQQNFNQIQIRQDPQRPKLELGKDEKSRFTVKQFIFGKALSGKKKYFVRNFLDEIKHNQKDATTFKCNENILTNVECISQKYVTAAMYISIFAFYIISFVIPFTETKECSSGHPTITYVYYGVYVLISLIVELLLTLYLFKKVDDKKLLRLNKYHIIKLFTGQMARMDFFTDVLFIMQLYSCKYYTLLYLCIFILVISSSYMVMMVFRLMIKDHSNLLENIERNCKLAYISEHQTIAIILDSFSLNNFEIIGEKTVTIPKIVSCFKSFIEDLPQFIIQVIYLLAYSQNVKESSTIYLSILLGAFSFGMSIHHALHAKSSNVDVSAVFDKLQERLDSNQDLSLDDEIQIEDQKDQLNETNQSINQNGNKMLQHSSTIQIQPKIHPKQRRISMMELRHSNNLIGKKLDLLSNKAQGQSPIKIKPSNKEDGKINKINEMRVQKQLETSQDQLLSSHQPKVAFAEDIQLDMQSPILNLNNRQQEPKPIQAKIQNFNISDGDEILKNIRQKSQQSQSQQSQQNQNSDDFQDQNKKTKIINIQKNEYNNVNLTNQYTIQISNQIIQPSNNQ